MMRWALGPNVHQEESRMKKIVIAALAASIGAASAVYAQETKPLGLSVRAGLFFPTSGDARDEGQTWISGGLDYKLGDLKFGNNRPGYSSHYSISADYYGKGDFRNIPVLLNWVARNDQFYYSAGAGVGFARFPDSATTTRSKTIFSYALAVGYDFQKGTTPIFVEGRYMGASESKLAGFGVFLGVRL